MNNSFCDEHLTVAWRAAKHALLTVEDPLLVFFKVAQCRFLSEIPRAERKGTKAQGRKEFKSHGSL